VLVFVGEDRLSTTQHCGGSSAFRYVRGMAVILPAPSKIFHVFHFCFVTFSPSPHALSVLPCEQPREGEDGSLVVGRSSLGGHDLGLSIYRWLSVDSPNFVANATICWFFCRTQSQHVGRIEYSFVPLPRSTHQAASKTTTERTTFSRGGRVNPISPCESDDDTSVLLPTIHSEGGRAWR
jgi:hypothetical protein